MREVRRNALVAASPATVFELINGVEQYPLFLPWCTQTHVESRSESQMVATLYVSRGPLRTDFTTRNELDPYRSVHISCVRGPFESLEGLWTLTPLGEVGCRVELLMRFQFSNAVSGAILEPVFAQMAGSLVDAFVSRARTIARGP
jgi:ribosome-associated toxin RatA of RatAB toxin-antitoxin module